MKVIAINGSPRKNWNTATLLQKALDGAASQGAETEIFHLYELNYKGCVSCFACKTKNGPSYGMCAVKDDLTPILKKVEIVDAIIFGSPIYYGSVTGEMRSFMERLLFPYSTYTDPPGTLFPRKIRTGFIYTLNASEAIAKSSDMIDTSTPTKRCSRGFSALQKYCAATTHTSSRIIQGMSPRVSIPLRKQSGGLKYFQWIVKMPLRWEQGLSRNANR